MSIRLSHLWIAPQITKQDASGESGLTWLLTDHLGSSSTAVRWNGTTSTYAITAEMRYTSATPPTDLRFTGQRLENGLDGIYDFKARFFDPAVGRFLAPDSIVPGKGNPLGFDRYAYVANNPVSRTDPGGHCWGIASGIRGLPTYGTTCNNLDMALTIVQSERASATERVVAGAYITGEFVAHGTALVYGGLALCGYASPACYKVLTAGPGILEAICRYGNCAERLNQLKDGVNRALNFGSSPKGLAFTSDQVDAVQNYLSTSPYLDDAFDPDISPYNIAMVQRQRDIIAGKLTASQYDINFMQHELLESQLVGSGIAQQDAHRKALETFNLTGEWDLYAKEVYDQYRYWMANSLWDQHMNER